MGFSCTTPPRKPLSKGVKIGVGVAGGILGLSLLILFTVWKIKRDDAKEGNKLPGYHLARLDPVPKYPIASTTEEVAEGGGDGDPVSHADEELHGSSHPPAYGALSGQPRENAGDRGNEIRTDHNV